MECNIFNVMQLLILKQKLYEYLRNVHLNKIYFDLFLSVKSLSIS